MLAFFDPLRDFSMASVCIRMVLAFVCGGIVGLEREYKRRPAGFRTHILICIGAAMTTLTSQYLFLVMHLYTDMARLGAQVVAGIGFIGAGTIIVTRHQRVKGLTTAAGLWASAIVGLALGAGFYEGGLMTTVLIFLAEAVLSRLEYRIFRRSPEVNLIMEYQEKRNLDTVLQLYQEWKVKVLGMEITRSAGDDKKNACALFYLRLNKNCTADSLLDRMHRIEGILSVEEF